MGVGLLVTSVEMFSKFRLHSEIGSVVFVKKKHLCKYVRFCPQPLFNTEFNIQTHTHRQKNPFTAHRFFTVEINALGNAVCFH